MSVYRGLISILGTSEIGTALATRLHAKGYKLHFSGRRKDALQSLASSFSGSEFSLIEANNPESIEAAVKSAGKLAKAYESGIGLVGIAYCIGSIPLKSLRSSTVADFTECFMVNTVGAAVAIRAGAPFLSLAPGGGSVVLFSSVAVQKGFPMHSIISSAKGGIEGLTRAAAAELSPSIRVNAIAPSLTDTKLASRILASDSAKATLGKLHPIPRVGNADDQASLASWLLDANESSWVTGQVIGVDGGRSSISK